MRKYVIFAAFAVIVAMLAAGAMAVAADGQALYQSRCAGCHGKQGEASGGTVADMDAAAIKEALNKYKTDRSFGGERKVVMQGVAKRLSDAEIEAISEYAGPLGK